MVDEKGKQLGVIPIQEALFLSRQKGFDLVEVASSAKPPVCKIIDFKKFKYQEDKKLKAGQKGKRQEIKEIRFTPFIAKNDYLIRLNRVKEFLTDGHKVRLTVKFIGRQITRKQFGYDLLKKAVTELEAISKVESEPKLQGKLLTMVLTPSQTNYAKTKNEKVSSEKV